MRQTPEDIVARDTQSVAGMAGRTSGRCDYNTIDLPALRALPTLRLGELRSPYGRHAAGDAPGYPTYFLQQVTTLEDTQLEVIADPEQNGVYYVLASRQDWHDLTTFAQVTLRREERLRRLWCPLPMHHERVRLWMIAAYCQQQRCYLMPEGESEALLRLDHNRLTVDRLFLWSAPAQAEPVATAALAAYATPDNYLPVIRIRRFYPNHQPILEWIETPPLDQYQPECRWWTTASAPPSEMDLSCPERAM